jgi:predicted nicotinamide N-methyase
MAADDLVEEIVTLRPGAEPLTVLRPRDAEALLTEEAFEREEYLPYWAELWPSGVALARRVAARPPRRGARVLELGCGLGLPSLVAARAGGRVLATDWSPDAIALLSQNAAHNEVDHLDLAPVAWDDPAAFLGSKPPRSGSRTLGDRSPRSSSKRHAPASSRTRGPTTSIRR